MPSFKPLVLSPITVDAARIFWYTSRSIRFNDSRALLAIWIGPPNDLYSVVFSKTRTPQPSLSKTKAAQSPPIPPPVIMTSTLFLGLLWSLCARVANIRSPSSSSIGAGRVA
eukprot:6200695-Pleurochrysis_carterae.AAC.1